MQAFKSFERDEVAATFAHRFNQPDRDLFYAPIGV
jgi:hypothetical protein